jgi:hypothetical protein
MSTRPKVLEQQGPYSQHPPVAAACALSERAWATYHEFAGGHEREGETLREFLFTRMVYIAEVTSTAVRLNSSWALTHPAMSLLRDRYEQTVRFSWLLRSPNDEYHKYGRAFFAKMNSLVREMTPEMRKFYDKWIGEPPAWATETPTKEARAYFEAWNTLDLRSMATKRDALPPVSESRIGKQPLADLYGSIYAQFSSVTHYDRFSVEMLGLHKAPNGQLVLAPDPHWPAMLTLHVALFDLIFCYEAVQLCLRKESTEVFGRLLDEWYELMDKVLPK